MQLTKDSVRVLLVDDHVIFRHGLRLMIESQFSNGAESQRQIEIVGEAGNSVEALAMAAHHQPDVILLDLVLHDENGLDLLPKLFVVAGRARVLVLTGVNNTEEHYQAIRLGAMGVITKRQTPESLFRAIESVSAGESWLEQSLTIRLLNELSRDSWDADRAPEADKVSQLTHREREVVALIGGGLKNKQIADKLKISEVTVRHHLTSIFRKLRVNDRLELALYAYQNGLAKLPFKDFRGPAENLRAGVLT